VPDTKSTQLTIREDQPTAISSSMHGANVDAMAFNVAFIALKNPKLAVELIKLYNEAHAIKASDPKAPDEDIELFNEALENLPDETTDKDT
jgi:hypothetical protein